ncbi:MAG: hypothetical protein JW798_17990 [Prolixibacteraceae bacterium]|nr:hypothetical protein [Prolixibacteraceae bacterium]
MRKLLKYCAQLFFIFSTFSSNGQYSNIVYTLGNTPQANLLNPSRITDNSVVTVHLPLLSGIDFRLNNSFSMDNFLTIDEKTLIINFDQLYSQISFENYFTEQISLPLIGLQIRLHNNFFSASITEKQLFRWNFDRNLIKLINEGNEAFIDVPFSTHFDFNFAHYREYALGYARNFDGLFTVGAKFKLLTGFSTVDVEKMNLGLTTGRNFEYLTLSVEGDYNLCLPVNINPDNENSSDLSIDNYLTNFNNLGMAIDLGASVNLLPDLEISASVIDLGFIHWKDNVTNISHEGSFRWQGLDLNSFISTPEPIEGEDVPNPNPINELMDSIYKLIDFQYASNPFTTGTPTRIFIAGEYSIFPVLSVSLTDQIMIFDKQVSNSLTFAGNLTLGKMWSLSAGYSIIDRSYNNLSLATSLKLGPFEMWAATNNILALKIQETSNFNLMFGLNLMFGKNEPPSKRSLIEMEP